MEKREIYYNRNGELAIENLDHEEGNFGKELMTRERCARAVGGM